MKKITWDLAVQCHVIIFVGLCLYTWLNRADLNAVSAVLLVSILPILLLASGNAAALRRQPFKEAIVLLMGLSVLEALFYYIYGLAVIDNDVIMKNTEKLANSTVEITMTSAERVNHVSNWLALFVPLLCLSGLCFLVVRLISRKRTKAS